MKKVRLNILHFHQNYQFFKCVFSQQRTKIELKWTLNGINLCLKRLKIEWNYSGCSIFGQNGKFKPNLQHDERNLDELTCRFDCLWSIQCLILTWSLSLCYWHLSAWFFFVNCSCYWNWETSETVDLCNVLQTRNDLQNWDGVQCSAYYVVLVTTEALS